jgi:hypothetical protein
VIPLTDELLRRRLVERADRAPELSLAAIARSVTAEPRRRWLPIAGGRIAILGPVAAVLVVAVAIAGGLLSRVAPPAVSGGSASPGTATASPASIAAWSSLTWEKTSPVPFESDETIVNDAIAVGDGFVAVGTTEANHALTGHVWLSPDGRTWERIDDPGIATLVPARVMAVGDTIVVLGDRRTPGDAAKHVELWRSADGVEWTQGPSLPVPGDAVSAAGGPAGILLPVDRRMFVIGPELDAWTETTTWPADVYLGSPAWADGRWIQPGATGVVGANAPTTATVWTSVDGRAWTARTMTQSTGAAFRVFAAADGLVAIGQSTNLCLFCYGPLIQPQTAWWSADGTAWSAIDLHLRPGDRTEFAGDGRRLLDLTGRLGSGDEPLAKSVSESLDGRTWTPIELVDPAPGANAFAGHVVVVGSHGVAILPGSSVDRSSGAFHPQPWWGAPIATGPTGSPNPEPSTIIVPGVVGCDELGFDGRRCAAVVARATELAGDPAGVVTIVVRKAPVDTTHLGSHPIATVGFTLGDGTSKTVEIHCLNVVGAVSSDRVCSDDPQIRIDGGVSHDVPCGPDPCDEQHPGATPPPSPRPEVIAASEPLVLPAFDVPLDHVGHYDVLVGSASLPDGLLSERSGELADTRPTSWWIDSGVQIVVRPGEPCTGESCQQIDSIYHDPFAGPQPVHVYLVFDVVELETPGVVLEVRNLVVR